MNIQKADYGTIIQFGSMQDLKYKLQLDGKTLDEVIDTVDANGISLLEKCLTARKFDIAKELLDHNAKVNVITEDGCNEFHCIASNIRCEGALDIAKKLLERETSLEVKDKKYGNSALFTLCLELMNDCSDEEMKFLEDCMGKTHEYDDCNKAGFNLRRLIKERGTERLRQMMEDVQ